MKLCDELTSYVHAAFSGIWVQSLEPDEAEREIVRHARTKKWKVAVWDIAHGLRLPGNANSAGQDTGAGDPLAALRALPALAETNGTALLLLHNGASEANVRQALRIADAMSPCILFCDELDKGLSGVGGQGDSGVSTRLFGTLLTWLAETDILPVRSSLGGGRRLGLHPSPFPPKRFPMTATTLNLTDPRSGMTPAQRLRISSAAVRVSFTWLGVRKTLTPSQKTQAAETFGAESDFLSARKKLLDTTHSAYKDVTAIRGRVGAFWKALTLPYPDPGIRLIRQEQIDTFNQQMATFRQELNDAVACLDEHYAELQSAARCRLGNLYDPLDYPPTLRGLFDLAWEFPNVQPPDYLMQINPAIYEQEKARIGARFEEAVRLAEQAFVSEFAGLVSHLCERLSSQGDEKKVFRDTAVTNLVEFFNRFRSLNVHSNDQLDELVDQAQKFVRGVEPQVLRANETLRQHVATQLSSVQAVLDGMLVDRPRRSIIRNQPLEGGSS